MSTEADKRKSAIHDPTSGDELIIHYISTDMSNNSNHCYLFVILRKVMGVDHSITTTWTLMFLLSLANSILICPLLYPSFTDYLVVSFHLEMDNQQASSPASPNPFPPTPEQLLTLFKPKSRAKETGIKRTNKLLRDSSATTRLKIFLPPTPCTWITFFLAFTASMCILGFVAYEAIFAYVEDVQVNNASYTDALTRVSDRLSTFVTSFQCLSFAILFAFGLIAWSIGL